MSGILAVLTVVACGLAGSPLAGLVASATAVAGWRGRLRAGLAAGAVGVLLLLYGDPWLARPFTASSVALLIALLALAAAAGALYRPGEAGSDHVPHLHERSPGPRAGDVALATATSQRPRRQAGEESEASIELQIVQRFVRDMRTTLGTDEVLLWRSHLVAGTLQLFVSSAGSHDTGHLRTEPSVDSLVQWAAEQRLVAANSDADDALFLVAPVGSGDRMLGVLGVFARDRLLLDRDRTKAELVRYAAQAGLLLDLLADGRNTQRYRTRIGALLTAAERIQDTPDLEAFGHAICEVGLDASGTSRAAFVRWHESSATGTVVAVSPGHSVREGARISAESLVGTACREQQRFAIAEAYRMAPDYPLYAADEPRRAIGSIAVVPLIRARSALGALVLEGDAPGQVTHVEDEALRLLASVAAVALSNVLRLENERERASRDSLTGLPNRGVFDAQLRSRIAESDRFGQPLSLVLLDIDHFKSVNDSYGHDAGDAVLVAVARVVERAVRTIDVCARYGGEEIAVLLPQTPLDAARDVAERLRQAIAAQEVPVGGRTLTVTASLGVSCYPESAGSQEALFVGADQALYDAKGSGRNCVRSASVSAARA